MALLRELFVVKRRRRRRRKILNTNEQKQTRRADVPERLPGHSSDGGEVGFLPMRCLPEKTVCGVSFSRSLLRIFPGAVFVERVRLRWGGRGERRATVTTGCPRRTIRPPHPVRSPCGVSAPLRRLAPRALFLVSGETELYLLSGRKVRRLRKERLRGFAARAVNRRRRGKVWWALQLSGRWSSLCSPSLFLSLSLSPYLSLFLFLSCTHTHAHTRR